MGMLQPPLQRGASPFDWGWVQLLEIWIPYGIRKLYSIQDQGAPDIPDVGKMPKIGVCIGGVGGSLEAQGADVSETT